MPPSRRFDPSVQFDIESFDLCARANLKHAVARLEREEGIHRHQYEKHQRRGDLQLAVANADAAATLRELLRLPEGHYAA